MNSNDIQISPRLGFSLASAGADAGKSALGKRRVIFSYPAFRKQMVLRVEPLRCTWQSCARLGGRGSSPALLPPSTGRPSLTRSISAVAFGGVTSGRGRLPSALLSSFIPYSQQDACFVTPVPPPERLWSLLQRQQEVTTTPGPHPSGAARKETRLSLNPAVPRYRWIPRQSPSGSIGRPARSRSCGTPRGHPWASPLPCPFAGHTRVRVTELYSTLVIYL